MHTSARKCTHHMDAVGRGYEAQEQDVVLLHPPVQQHLQTQAEAHVRPHIFMGCVDVDPPKGRGVQ